MKSEHKGSLLALSLLVLGLVLGAGPARAGNLDAKESEELKQARQLYKSGNYQEAADIFSRLSASHPDMPIFARNAGAAYYYLKKPDPALSNLREYLRVQKKSTAEDREEVERWIAEMEQLRAQTPVAPAVPATPPAAPAPAAPPPTYPGYPSYAPAPGYAGAPGGQAPAAAGYPQGPAQAPATSATPQPPQPSPAYPPGYPAAAPAATTATAPVQYPPPGYPYGYDPTQPPQQPLGAPVPAQEVQESGAPRGRGALPWVIGGAGVACLALGGVFTYLYQSAYSDTRAQYNPDRESAGRTYSYLQFVGYGLGVAGVTTAAILLLKPGTSASRVSFSPALGPGLAGAEVVYHY